MTLTPVISERCNNDQANAVIKWLYDNWGVKATAEHDDIKGRILFTFHNVKSDDWFLQNSCFVRGACAALRGDIEVLCECPIIEETEYSIAFIGKKIDRKRFDISDNEMNDIAQSFKNLFTNKNIEEMKDDLDCQINIHAALYTRI